MCVPLVKRFFSQTRFGLTMSCQYCGRKFSTGFDDPIFAIGNHEQVCKAKTKAKNNVDVVSDLKKQRQLQGEQKKKELREEQRFLKK